MLLCIRTLLFRACKYILLLACDGSFSAYASGCADPSGTGPQRKSVRRARPARSAAGHAADGSSGPCSERPRRAPLISFACARSRTKSSFRRHQRPSSDGSGPPASHSAAASVPNATDAVNAPSKCPPDRTRPASRRTSNCRFGRRRSDEPFPLFLFRDT